MHEKLTFSRKPYVMKTVIHILQIFIILLFYVPLINSQDWKDDLKKDLVKIIDEKMVSEEYMLCKFDE